MDGITFDSKMESDYYKHLAEKLQNGEIRSFECQPVYLLQDKFKCRGKSYKAITYKADFKVVHNDGSVEVIDVKGFETTDFKIKKKMFLFKYCQTKLTLVTYVKKYGGWIELEELQRKRKGKA